MLSKRLSVRAGLNGKPYRNPALSRYGIMAFSCSTPPNPLCNQRLAFLLLRWHIHGSLFFSSPEVLS